MENNTTEWKERERGEERGEKIKIVQLLGKHVFFLSPLSLSRSPFFRTSDFAVQINVGRSGCLLLILALQLSNQKLSGNGVVIELHSLD